MAESVLCATVTVAENPARPEGRRIALHVVVLPRLDPRETGAPIVILPGGPGGDIASQAPGWSRLLRDLRDRHPVVLMDPRGTGKSNPLDCELTDPGRPASHVRDFLPLDKVRSCRATLARRADLTQYTTEHVAADLEQVRVTLGYPTVILYGLSGGTRQALVYLKRYPAHVEAMILAGMVPLSFRMPLHYARDSEAAFNALVADCTADAACARAYPRLRQHADQVVRSLQRKPAVVVAGADTLRITAGMFAERIRTLMYNVREATIIPYLVDRGASGDFLPFVYSIPGYVRPRNDAVAMGHFLSATCAEDVPRVPTDSARLLARGTLLGTYRVDQQTAACREWPRGVLPDDHFAPAPSDVPVLFISGAADPVTPPPWAHIAARDLTNSAHVVVAQAGHGPVNTGCVVGLITEFVRGRAPKRLDVSCGAANRRPPFVVGNPRGDARN